MSRLAIFSDPYRKIYNRAFEDLAGQPFDSFQNFAAIVPELLRLRAHRSVYDTVRDYISDPRLQMVFSFHPLFIGENPLHEPARFTASSHISGWGGVHYIVGGMYSLVQHMAELFEDLGGTIRTSSPPVAEILVEPGRATGGYGSSQERYSTRISSSRTPTPPTPTTSFCRQMPARRPCSVPALDRYRYSMSCFLLYLGLDRQFRSTPPSHDLRRPRTTSGY
ncbi:MAG: hypothetical protein R3A46_11850 [Thermomicrobiales bacterium]